MVLNVHPENEENKIIYKTHTKGENTKQRETKGNVQIRGKKQEKSRNTDAKGTGRFSRGGGCCLLLTASPVSAGDMSSSWNNIRTTQAGQTDGKTTRGYSQRANKKTKCRNQKVGVLCPAGRSMTTKEKDIDGQSEAEQRKQNQNKTCKTKENTNIAK